MPSLIIRNGTIVNAGGTFRGDVVIGNGIIRAISGPMEERLPGNIKEIDASGLYVLPGAIDAHVHFNLPTPAGFSGDDFYSGSRAALAGGTTTFIDFVTPWRGQSMLDALESRLTEAESSLSDYSLHMSVTSWKADTAKEIAKCFKRSITSFKTYLAYRDTIGINEDDLEKVMNAVVAGKGLVTVHCEDGERIAQLHNECRLQGQLGPEYHEISRPDYVESDEVLRVINIAGRTLCPVYFVHVSTAGALEHIRIARNSGIKVFAETCPQYLLFDKTKYGLGFPEALKYIISPPLRTAADNHALWKSIIRKNIDVLATDHCPFNLTGQKELGRNDFTKIPNGVGGVEHRLALLHTFGVVTGKISMNRFVELVSEMPARIFGLYPKKGIIAPGSDADIILWNPATGNTISSKTHLQRCDHNIYEGIKTMGGPYMVFTRGRIACHDGKINDGLKGKFLKR